MVKPLTTAANERFACIRMDMKESADLMPARELQFPADGPAAHLREWISHIAGKRLEF